uniref:Uncharacterized protein n=1 Tax=Octopus bimaculoides TaxID=37653 RepID=A0A0L8HE69_OCTBM
MSSAPFITNIFIFFSFVPHLARLDYFRFSLTAYPHTPGRCFGLKVFLFEIIRIFNDRFVNLHRKVPNNCGQFLTMHSTFTLFI